ncbi:MAG: hypothetical protein QW734_02120 [Candidatus Bathyarchaeia archaeon]
MTEQYRTCWEEFLRQAKEKYETEDVKHLPEMPAWHGTRRKESIKELKEKGFCTFQHPANVLQEIFTALKHFNKLDKLTDPLVASAVSNVCRFDPFEERGGLYVDFESVESQKKWGKSWATGTPTEKAIAPRTCSYANRNPEIVTLALAYAGVESPKIREYLRQRYGKPYAVKLKGGVKGDFPILNQATNCRCFLPSDIEEIYECPEEVV